MTRYDPDHGTSLTTSVSYTYDGTYGNIVHLLDEGNVDDPDDDVDIRMHYSTDASRHIVNRPTSIVVRDSDGILLRDRSGEYDTNGNLESLTQHNSAGGDSVTRISYDSYGNIQNRVDPGGYTLNYGYDTEVHTYPTSIGDSFGYESTGSYDVTLGVQTLAVDIGGSTVRREFDRFGRIEKIRTDYDDDSRVPAVEFRVSSRRLPASRDNLQQVEF